MALVVLSVVEQRLDAVRAVLAGADVVAELVYRHQLRPVIQTGATVMDQLFKRGSSDA